MEEITTISLNFSVFAVRSHDGKWFRAKGQNGYGDSWVSDIKTAKIYGKIGPARSCVTFWTNKYPNIPSPVIVEIVADKGIVHDEQKRLEKVKIKKLEEEQKRIKRNYQEQVKRAARDLQNAQDKLDKLKSGSF
jgi:hypothetical protein